MSAPFLQYLGGSAVLATTITIPAGHQAGDLLLIWSFRDGSTTNPSIPAGWRNLTNTLDTTLGSASCGWKWAASSSETSGTWTNANHLCVVAFRGMDSTSPLGAISTSNGVSTTVTYNAVTLKDTSSLSWVLAFASHRSTDTNLQTPPTDMTNVINLADATCETSFHRHALRGTNWASTNVSVAGTSSGWCSLVVELRAAKITNQNYMNVSARAGNTGIISLNERIR
jgi:hypothetical protein